MGRSRLISRSEGSPPILDSHLSIGSFQRSAVSHRSEDAIPPVYCPRLRRSGPPLFSDVTRADCLPTGERPTADGYTGAPNIAPTDSPVWIREMASPSNSDTDRMVTFGSRLRIGWTTVSVTISSSIGE